MFNMWSDRVSLTTLMIHYIVKNVGRARNWPLWADDRFTEVTVKAGLTVLIFLM